jgi:multiple sugar transport system ATP-binding protein
MTMAYRVAVLNQGQLVQVDTRAGVYNHPATSFVGGFLGSPPMNFIQCSLVHSSERDYLDGGGFQMILSDEDIQKVRQQEATELTLGVRPEDVLIHEKNRGEDLESEVYVIEPLRSEVIVNLKLGDNIIKCKAAAGFSPSIGQKVWMSFKDHKLAIFSKAGQAIA